MSTNQTLTDEIYAGVQIPKGALSRTRDRAGRRRYFTKDSKPLAIPKDDLEIITKMYYGAYGFEARKKRAALFRFIREFRPKEKKRTLKDLHAAIKHRTKDL